MYMYFRWKSRSYVQEKQTENLPRFEWLREEKKQNDEWRTNDYWGFALLIDVYIFRECFIIKVLIVILMNLPAFRASRENSEQSKLYIFWIMK